MSRKLYVETITSPYIMKSESNDVLMYTFQWGTNNTWNRTTL